MNAPTSRFPCAGRSAHVATVDVVIAEDSRIQAKILQKHLVEAGYQVRVAPNGAEALKLIQEAPPTIIISDIEMPEMDGYELCRRVKGDPQLRRIPLILLSTLGAPEDIIEGLHAGADNYVTKPYQADYLLSRVESLLHTPMGEEDPQAPMLEVTLAGKHYQVRSGRQQVLNLLISTFENAVEKNNELIRVNQELTVARDQLTQWNQQLTQLNEKLETANTRMSRDLRGGGQSPASAAPGHHGLADASRSGVAVHSVQRTGRRFPELLHARRPAPGAVRGGCQRSWRGLVAAVRDGRPGADAPRVLLVAVGAPERIRRRTADRAARPR